jgi:hypothetical protein
MAARMRARKANRFLIGFLLATALAPFACDNVSQPRPGCTVGQGRFAARYILKPGQSTAGACANKRGEVIGVRDYGQRGVDYSIAIQSEQPVNRRPSMDSVLYSLGLYSDDPGPDDFCTAQTLSPAVASYPEVITDGGVSPAIHRRYEWRNVRFLVTPLFPGTQMIGDLTYSESGCAAEFTVTGLWPQVSCASQDGGVRVPDPNKCATRDDPDAGIKVGCAGGTGSPCLSTHTRAVCDPDIFLCVLDGLPPVQQ